VRHSCLSLYVEGQKWCILEGIIYGIWVYISLVNIDSETDLGFYTRLSFGLGGSDLGFLDMVWYGASSFWDER